MQRAITAPAGELGLGLPLAPRTFVAGQRVGTTSAEVHNVYLESGVVVPCP